jgi:hypothetical protein
VRRPKADSFGMTDAAEKAFSVQYENYWTRNNDAMQISKVRLSFKNAKKNDADRS